MVGRGVQGVRRVVHRVGIPPKVRSGALRRREHVENVPWNGLRPFPRPVEAEALPLGQGGGRRGGAQKWQVVYRRSPVVLAVRGLYASILHGMAWGNLLCVPQGSRKAVVGVLGRFDH